MKTSLVLAICVALLSLAFARQRKAKVDNVDVDSQREGKCKIQLIAVQNID